MISASDHYFAGDEEAINAQKYSAAKLVATAWADAEQEGIEPEILSSAALFSAVTTLVEIYGENAVAALAEGLPKRIKGGEFSLRGLPQ